MGVIQVRQKKRRYAGGFFILSNRPASSNQEPIRGATATMQHAGHEDLRVLPIWLAARVAAKPSGHGQQWSALSCGHQFFIVQVHVHP